MLKQATAGLALVLAGCLLPVAAVLAEAARPLAVYVVVGPDGQAIARAVTSADHCPTISLDAATSAMSLRAAPDEAFPVRVCETPIPAGSRRASIGSEALPLPVPGTPRRVVALGDTGCRMKHGHPFQACNDPKDWPFDALARSAASVSPDLVIHTGDYLYRELECPPGNAGCAGSPVGNRWATWQTDFFGPAAPLLRSAPWVVLRGDHELCARAGGGFFRLLDPRPLAPTCDDFSEPYRVRLGDLSMIVMDASGAAVNDAQRIAAYTRQFERLGQWVDRPTWLLVHQPIRALRSHGGEGAQVLTPMTVALQQASAGRLPPAISFVLSSHIHMFQALAFADSSPPQLVIGHGGTSLDPVPKGALVGLAIAGATVSQARVEPGFGFVSLEPGAQPGTWSMTIRDTAAAPRGRCLLGTPRLDCDR
jgi:hypothetical protein